MSTNERQSRTGLVLVSYYRCYNGSVQAQDMRRGSTLLPPFALPLIDTVPPHSCACPVIHTRTLVVDAFLQWILKGTYYSAPDVTRIVRPESFPYHVAFVPNSSLMFVVRAGPTLASAPTARR